MKPRTVLILFVLVFLQLLFRSHCLQVGHHSISNITVIGTVFCDTCSNNTFTKHSYFLQGAKVQVQCSFKANSATKEEILLTVDRTTNRFGIYRVDIPPVDGFECREGREIESFCKASLLESSTSMCNVPGLSISAAHLALKFTQSNLCIYNLNALNYRPSNKDVALCGSNTRPISNNLNSSLFFWPPCPPFTSWHFPQWPFPPFPFQKPPPFPFPFTFPFPFSPPPSSFPFPFPFSPPPPSLPFPFPPLGPLPPMPFPFTPSPPPPSFPFPFPPLPPFTPIPVPFTPSPPPPSPPPPFLPFPFPPFGPIPFIPSPPPPALSPPSFPFPFPPFPPIWSSPPPPPPPSFSFMDPRTWFPFPPSTTHNQKLDP